MGKTANWRFRVLTVLLLASNLSCGRPEPGGPRTGPETTSPDDWTPLFNGRDLDGWVVKIRGFEAGDNYGDTFRVQDSLLTVSYDGYEGDFAGRFGHLFYREPFSHYLLRVEYRFVGEQAPGGPDWALRNSGVMLHSQSPESMGRNQDFPISIEVQFLGGTGTGERSTANLCTPGTHVEIDGQLVTDHCIPSSSRTYNGDVWVRSETLVLGDSLIRHMVDGETVLEYAHPQFGGGVVNDYDPSVKRDGEPLREGYIALQSESHPIQFRRVELLNLKGCMDPESPSYRPYYVAPDPSACE